MFGDHPKIVCYLKLSLFYNKIESTRRIKTRLQFFAGLFWSRACHKTNTNNVCVLGPVPYGLDWSLSQLQGCTGGPSGLPEMSYPYAKPSGATKQEWLVPDSLGLTIFNDWRRLASICDIRHDFHSPHPHQ